LSECLQNNVLSDSVIVSSSLSPVLLLGPFADVYDLPKLAVSAIMGYCSRKSLTDQI